MKRKIIRILLWILGISPFVYPLMAGIYTVSVESMSLFDYLILYSFLYWPTYIIGAALITAALVIQIKNKK